MRGLMPKPVQGGVKINISLPLDPDLLDEVDTKRGHVPRGLYLRELIRQALARGLSIL